MPFVLTFIEQHLLAFLAIWTVIATLSWSIVRKNSAVKDGLDLRFLGTALIILAVTTASLFHAPPAFSFAVLMLGSTLSIFGGMKSRSARRSRLESSTSEKTKN
jgi:hypothetical protein